MAFTKIQITEIFHSIQGETSQSGLRFAFIRLTGCNLRCSYCDSAYAFKGGKALTIEEILERIKPYQVKNVLLTGGEPLLQRNTPELAQALIEAGYRVSIETHGEVSIQNVAEKARIVMDIKTPGSQMSRGNYVKNLSLLKAGDEVKFVITDRADYEWSKSVLQQIKLPPQVEIVFSPVVKAAHSPQNIESFDLKWVAESIIKDQLNVRLQTQLHKLIWGPEKTGV